MPLCAFTVSAYTPHLRQIIIPHTSPLRGYRVIEPPLWLPVFITHPHATNRLWRRTRAPRRTRATRRQWWPIESSGSDKKASLNQADRVVPVTRAGGVMTSSYWRGQRVSCGLQNGAGLLPVVSGEQQTDTEASSLFRSLRVTRKFQR